MTAPADWFPKERQAAVAALARFLRAKEMQSWIGENGSGKYVDEFLFCMTVPRAHGV